MRSKELFFEHQNDRVRNLHETPYRDLPMSPRTRVQGGILERPHDEIALLSRSASLSCNPSMQTTKGWDWLKRDGPMQNNHSPRTFLNSESVSEILRSSSD
jgi:hypothetical protein